MKGWFDAFRTDGGPTLYSFQNRTPVTEDVHSIIIYLVFTTVFVAFLIVFPGIRKERLTTFVSVIISLFVGAVILLCNCGSGWHVATARISSPYRAFSREKITAHLGVYIGLNSVNITLRGLPDSNLSGGIDYNERFYWTEATDFKEGYREALRRGLPFPILTVAEYLSLEEEGFCWGSRYRIAGYYSNILMWTAFAMWILMNILFCVVPRYGAYTMTATGLLQLLTNAVYYCNLPSPPMVIPFEGASIRLRLGWSFWLILVTGFLCVVVGIVIAVMDVVFPHKFSTVLEVDYDTPYDRHIILQDTVKQKVNEKRKILSVESSEAVGSQEELVTNKRRRDGNKDGFENAAFEEEKTNSTSWRLPTSPALINANENRRQQSPDVNIDVQAAAMW